MEVTLEDQQKINTFSQLNTRKHELEDMLRVKAVRIRTGCWLSVHSPGPHCGFWHHHAYANW